MFDLFFLGLITCSLVRSVLWGSNSDVLIDLALFSWALYVLASP